MAQTVDNIVTKGFFGSLDKTLTFRQRAGVTIVSKKRRASSAAPSEAMLAVRSRFLTAVAYGKKAMLNAATKALYKTAATGLQSAYNVATADAFTPPVVNKIDSSAYHGAVGDTLEIEATDNFKVSGVVVTIDSAAGALIETGNAVLDENGNWKYTATVANGVTAGSKITAVASDLPGNTGTLSVTL